MTVSIRPYTEQDWPQLWAILNATFAEGETYAFPTDWSEEETRVAWVCQPQATFVAVNDDDEVLGSYYLKANYAGNASHVANCGYVVAAAASGRGIATMMCEHSQIEARAHGFLAMQFNFVVATNHRALNLWKRLGFEIVGRLPQAFRHPHQGLVDAYVMYKALGI